MNQTENDTSLEMFKSAVSAGENSLKTVILINGGAAIAMLTFIGNKPTTDVDVAIKLLFSMILFGVGAFFGGLATCFHYQDRITRNKKYYQNKNGKNLWDKLCDGCVVLSYIVFFVGFFLAVYAFWGNYNSCGNFSSWDNLSETGSTVVIKPIERTYEYTEIFYPDSMEMIYKLIFIILGVTYLCVGLGTLLAPKYYKQIMANFKTSKLIVHLSGFFALATGLLIVTFHNLWVKDIAVIVTIIGWLALIKGVTILALPKLMTKIMDIFINAKISTLRIMASFVIILGIILALLGILAA